MSPNDIRRSGPAKGVTLNETTGVLEARPAPTFDRLLTVDVGQHVDAALSYATLGWPVFPVHEPTASECSCGKDGCKSPGKHPRTKNGVSEATTDPAQVVEWWSRWP